MYRIWVWRAPVTVPRQHIEERAPPSPAGLFATAFRDYCLQSAKPAASGGFAAELEVEPAPVELVLLLPLMGLVLVLLPKFVLGVSLRTCLVTLSQHFIEPGVAALGHSAVPTHRIRRGPRRQQN